MNRWRIIWYMALGAVLFLGAALVTLRAAEQAAAQASSHAPPSVPEESATIEDDPTVAPDAAQSADHNVSFPTDI